jgi:hypothetical protein
MTDPIRWSEVGNSASEVEQLLVRAGQELHMPSGEKQAVWNQILSTLPRTGAVTASATIASSSFTKSLLAFKSLKALSVMVAVSGLVLGGHLFLKEPHPAKSIESVAAIVPEMPVPLPMSPTFEAQPSVAPPESSGPTSAATQATPTSRTSQLREESLAVMAVRRVLLANDPVKALELLEQAQKRFKRGAMAEEREALTIEALAKSGQNTRASVGAKAFLSNYPRSPHASNVRRFLVQ